MAQVSRRSLAIGVALLCLPTLVFIWWNRDVPHFGILEDDGIYLIGAKSLAEGSQYRILNLPAEPYQTKYPPLYPLYLSLAWRAAATFTAKLSAAVILSWLSLPMVLWLFHVWLRRHGFDQWPAWLLTALFGLNPYVLFFISNLGSEIFFMVFLLATILVAEKPDRNYALLAGVIAGFGYLARTAGIALLPAALIYYLWNREPRKALWFTVGMAPAIACWTLWSQTHAAPQHDIVTLYYTNYLGYQLFNVTLDNIAVVLWKNLSALLESFGSYVFPQMLQGLPAKLILQPLALAMVLGCIRMSRRGNLSLYTVFGAVSTAMLLVWHFPPNQRFVLPLVPLLLAGFYREATHFGGLVRTAFQHKDRSQRVVAYAFAGFLIAILGIGAGLQVYMWVSVIPEQARSDRKNASEYAAVYRWMDANAPAGASILLENDTALYLLTGRHAVAFLIPPRQWYQSENDEDLASYRRIDEYARDHQVDFIVLPTVGPHRNPEVLKAAAENVNLEGIHEEAGGVIYRVKKQAGTIRK